MLGIFGPPVLLQGWRRHTRGAAQAAVSSSVLHHIPVLNLRTATVQLPYWRVAGMLRRGRYMPEERC